MLKKPFIEFGQTHHNEISALIDVDKPVQVYRNLTHKCWSVRQGGIVKLHTPYIILKKVKFKVSQEGRDRVLREQQKNVHAWVEGLVCTASEVDAHTADFEFDSITYNPYKYHSFVNRDDAYKSVDTAIFCDMMVDDQSPVLAFGAK